MTERDPLEGLYEVALTTGTNQIQSVISLAFGNSLEGAKCAKSCKRPTEFNLLLGWIPGNERWPVAALLLRRGLTSRGTINCTYAQISELVGRSHNAVNAAVGSKGMKSVFRKIETAWRLMGSEPLRNELRLDLGLPSEIWVTLARRRGIRTIDALERAVKDGSVYRIDGFGDVTMGKLTAALEDRQR